MAAPQNTSSHARVGIQGEPNAHQTLHFGAPVAKFLKVYPDHHSARSLLEGLQNAALSPSAHASEE
jgi:hypothetical protein